MECIFFFPKRWKKRKTYDPLFTTKRRDTSISRQRDADIRYARIPQHTQRGRACAHTHTHCTLSS
jgi:hypothetical protein